MHQVPVEINKNLPALLEKYGASEDELSWIPMPILTLLPSTSVIFIVSTGTGSGRFNP